MGVQKNIATASRVWACRRLSTPPASSSRGQSDAAVDPSSWASGTTTFPSATTVYLDYYQREQADCFHGAYHHLALGWRLAVDAATAPVYGTRSAPGKIAKLAASSTLQGPGAGSRWARGAASQTLLPPHQETEMQLRAPRQHAICQPRWRRWETVAAMVGRFCLRLNAKSVSF